MAAMSAASGAFAHDFNWNFASLEAAEDAKDVKTQLDKLPYGNPLTPKYGGVQATGTVKITKDGLAFSGVASDNIYFDVQANDEITITATGSKSGKFYVAFGSSITTAEMKDNTTLKVNVGTATSVQVWATGDVAISAIAVQSSAYRNVQKKIDETLEIMNRRIEDINGYAAEVPGFYLKVKGEINAQGKQIKEIGTQLLKAAGNNEVSNANGAAGLIKLLKDVQNLIGTKGDGATTATELGTIYTNAADAYSLYDKIVTTKPEKMATEVKNANDIIVKSLAKEDKDWDATYANPLYTQTYNKTTKKNEYTETWAAAKTASKVGAVTVFNDSVVGYRNALIAGAKEELEKYPEIAGLSTYAAKFDVIATRAQNVFDRYTYEESLLTNSKSKNYVAIKNLSESVEKMVKFSANNTELFDQTGLSKLAEDTKKLYTELADRKNVHSIAKPATYFGTPYTNLNKQANTIKTTWGKAAKAALEKEYTEVQKKLDACSEAIATKFQNDQEKLKEYELKFAAQQAKISAIKKQCNDATKASDYYTLASDYAKHMETLSKVKTELGSLWSDTQTAENAAIIKANNESLAQLLKDRDAARAQYNKAVAQLDSYRNGKFFAKEYTSNGKEYETLKTNIAKSIKTLYDYSVLIEDAYTGAETKVTECNKEGKPGEIVAEKADLTKFSEAIKTNADLIKAALDKTVADANDAVKTFFEATDNSRNNYMPIEQATTVVNSYDTNTYSYDVPSVAKIKKAYSDFESEAAFADASKEIGIAVSGTNDKKGKLILTTEDIASAVYMKDSLYNLNPQVLADDVVKADSGVVVNTIKGAIKKADDTVAKLQSYVELRKRMFDSSVEWSIAQSKAANADKEIKAELIKYLGELNEEMKAAEDSLVKTDKLNADVKAYTKMLDNFDARIANAKDPVAFKKYLAIEAAKVEIDGKVKEAEARIKDAKDELAKLTKENAQNYLKEEIAKSETALTAVKTDIANSKDLDADKAQIIADLAKIDLKVAIAAAKKLDTVVEGDLDGDGVVSTNDLDIAVKKYNTDTMTQDEYSVFLEVLKKSLNK